MPNAKELKDLIDLHDLAEKLGLERPGNKGNYRSPTHDDKTPSLSIMKDGKKFNDFSGGPEARGDCIDFVMYVEGINDTGDAMRRLHELYGLEFDKPNEPAREKTLVDYIADNVMKNPGRCKEYLTTERAISEVVIDRCIQRKTLGFNEYENPKNPHGEIGHGGPGVSFIARDLQNNLPIAIDTRYIDPAGNGGVKSNCQGDKNGCVYVPDPRKLKDKEVSTVVIVESPINALTVETFGDKYTTAVATFGTENHGIDWGFLQGKVAVLCMDNDKPHEKSKKRPGQEAAWRIHEELVAFGIPCLFVDQRDWGDVNDLNDFAREFDKNCTDYFMSETRRALKKLEPWLIPGVVGKEADDAPNYNRRVYLPSHDYAVYWKYRVTWDFTSFVKPKKDDDGNDTYVSEDVCGFRIASLSRVNISGVTSVMSGEKDSQPKVVFAASVQSARHKELLRRVMNDETLHNVDQWRKFGAIYRPSNFSRLLNIWERATDIGARDAVNFVGLCWRNGKPQMNEGADCFFIEPEKQCPYYNLRFPSGNRGHAKQVIKAYQETFKENAAAILLVWAIGAQLKAFMGFWPHMMLQADKGSGKSVLCKRLERTLAFTMFSGQSLQTEFRLLTSVAHTSHPVGWEEISARKQDVIDKATSILQESYQYSVTKRGGEMTEYLVSAPVLLAGEDVPVKTLLQKLVRTDITGKQGPMMSETLPRFPMREWIQYLAGQNKQRVLDLFNRIEQKSKQQSAARDGDSGAARIIRNYSALQVAWVLLCDFAGIDTRTGGFGESCLAEMNRHISETESDREPWVWIMDIVLGEIDRGNYPFPFKFEAFPDGEGGKEDCLIIRMPHIMQHLSQTPALKDKFNALPVKQHSVLKKQLGRAGVIYKDDFERSIRKSRVTHCTALSIRQLNLYGLHPAVPDDYEG